MKTMNWNTTGEELVQSAEREDVVLMRDGHAVALVTTFDDDDLEWYAAERAPAFLASIARARQQVQQGHTRSQPELKQELGVD